MSVRLARGIRVSVDAREWLITQVNHSHGFVRLCDDEGEQTTMPLEEFVTHPHIEEITAKPASMVDAAVERLDKRAREILSKRIAHVYEVETGYRSGTPEVALPHEPRPEYDPATTTLTERRLAKARELNNEHAADAGTKMSVATIRRIGKSLNNGCALSGTVDRRHVRRSPGRISISKEVEAACEEVFEKTRLESNRTHAARYLLVKQYLREVYGYEPGDEPVPHEKTIRRWFQDRFIPSELNGKARTRRSATSAPAGGFSRANPSRPGELVCIDTCSLDVLLKGTEFEGVLRGVIVMAVDWYSRSIVAIRVLEGSEQAIDVTFLLREIGRPKPMMPGWGDENRWPFVGLPEQILTDTFGDDTTYSAMPFVNAEAVVTDHGNTYKAHINVAAATQQGISILPARVRTGSDKQVVERAFGSFRTMLLQYLSGYRGTDASERGSDVDAQVKYDAQDIEDLASWWAVRIWQNHELSDARPDWCPEGTFSPNSLYEFGLAQTGVPLRVMSSNDYYALLPTVHVRVRNRGVKVRGLYYDGAALSDPTVRNEPSPYGGRHKNLWTVRFDPRDLRRVFFLDRDGVYQPLTWVGASRNTPCFNDRHAAALTSLRIKHGIGVMDQDALAEILLSEILAVHEPVENWPTLSPKGRKIIKDRSRLQRQQQMVERDQAASGLSRFPESFDQADGGPEPVEAAPERPVSAVTALDSARARKNAAQVPPEKQDGVQAAPRLGSGMKTMFGVDASALQAARDAARTSTEPATTEPAASEVDDSSLTEEGDEEA